MEIPSMVCSQNGALIVRSLVSGDLLHPPTLSAARDDTKGDSQEPAAISVSTKINHENEDQSSSLVVSLKVPTNNNNNNNNEAFEDHHCEENGQSSKKDEKLPQCKIKRNYSCNNCSYFTQNPRRFLMHLRDTHGERITINDCKLCLYASRHYQKLVRHMRMVHGSTEGINEPSQSRRGQRGWKPGRKRSLEEDEELIDEPNFIPTNGLGDEHEYKSKLEKCTMCSFTTLSRDSLIAHEREDHAKTKFFRCHKCSYVTHIKARFSKHVKYHSMPMIKCMMCDFRTPYKWNLDRHMKNHGGAGPYKCSACSFSADIKQSLTVHETNHHIPPIEHNGGGTGDLPGHHRARGDWPEDLSMSSSQNSQEEDVPLDFTVAKTSDTELDSDSRPKKRPIPSLIPIQDSFNILKDMSKQNESSAYAAVGLLNEIYFKTLKNISLMFANSSSTPASDDVVTVEDDIPATVPKKAISMFEKLKEKMVSGVDDECQCGYKAKSLSDMLLHQNACQAHNSRTEPASSPSLYGSTRCQFCRHRCKTTDDLLLHLRVCEAKDEICKQESSDEAAIDNPDASDWGEEKPQPMNFFDQILCSNIEEISDDLGDLNGRKSGNFVSMKKVFKCPHCSFWASTASRFHVHIVGHLNKKPFECSLCSYRSNWRWDITKHIRLKTVRDINHKNAKVLMNDETGRRNYTKYNKYVTLMGVGESDIHSKQSKSEDSALSPTELVPPSNSSDTSGSSRDNNLDGALNFAAISNRQQRAILAQLHQQPQGTPQNTIVAAAVDESHSDVDSNSIKRTNFKCKKCDFKSYDRDEVMGHVKQHFLDVGISFMNPAPSSTPPLINIPLPPALQKPMDAPPSRMVTNLLDIMPNITIKPPPLAGHLVPNGNGSHSEPSMAGGSNSSVISSPSSLLMLNPSALNKAPSAAAATPSSNSLLKGTGATSTTILLSNIAAGSNNQTNNPMQGAGGSAITTNTSTATSSSNSTSAWRGPAPYRCGHCHQVSNWKHVIQRHCRLKHNGNISIEHLGKTSSGSSDNRRRQRFPTPSSSSTPAQSPAPPLLLPVPVTPEAPPSDAKRYKCRFCPYESNSKSQLQYHSSFHNSQKNAGEEVFNCSYCTYSVTRRHLLLQHLKMHTGAEAETIEVSPDLIPEEPAKKQMFYCPHCPARYMSKTEIDTHLGMHDGGLAFRCKLCTYSAATDSNMQAHVTVHSTYYQEKTREFQRKYQSNGLHPAPKVTLADVAVPSTSGDASGEQFWVVDAAKKAPFLKIREPHLLALLTECKFCPFTADSPEGLKAHVVKHRVFGGLGFEHVCETCDYSCESRDELSAHKRLHFSFVSRNEESKNPASVAFYTSYDKLELKCVDLSGGRKRGSGESETEDELRTVYRDDDEAHRQKLARLSAVKEDEKVIIKLE